MICLFYRPSLPLKKTNNSCTQRVKIIVNLGVVDLLNELLCNLAQLGLLDVVHHHRQHGQQLVLGKFLTQRGSLLFALVSTFFWATRILQTVHLFNVAPPPDLVLKLPFEMLVARDDFSCQSTYIPIYGLIYPAMTTGKWSKCDIC